MTFSESENAAKDLAVGRIPGIVIRGKGNRPLRFLGLPTGAQFPGFIETLVEASRGGGNLSPQSTRELRKVKDDVDVKILVSPSCSHSPVLVRTAFNIRLQNGRVKVTAIEAGEFPDLIQQYIVRAVPTTVINESVAIKGAMDEATLIEVLQRTVEGKPLRDDMKAGPITPMVATNPRKVPNPGPPGLIIPR